MDQVKKLWNGLRFKNIIQLAEIIETVSLPYIAKKYFNKSRSWLHQHSNADIVNNKPAQFTIDEIKTFNFALKGISEKISSTSISL